MMKKLITGALAMTLLASTAGGAFAQEHHRGRGGDGDRSQADGDQGRGRGQREDGGDRSRAAPEQHNYNPAVRRGRGNWPGEAQQPPQAAPAPQAQEPRHDGGGDRGRGGGGRDWRGDDGRADRGGDRRGDDRRGDDRRWGDNRWNDGRDRDRERPRYDRRSYPSVWRTPQRYRAGPYRPPSGWYARSWGYGQIIPRGWYGSQYRLMDWWSYGLPIPPIGYAWVRVGDDALLVDEYSGRVVQVVYDLFW